MSGQLVWSPAGTARLAEFEAERTRLVGIAYRMLGSRADAEDAVQEAWLRWDRLGADGRARIERPAAWLTTTVSRLALDRLKSAQRQREEYVGPWLPEPVTDMPDPADSVQIAESVTIGFLTVLERLGPVERAVFLLVDVFGESFADVAGVVGRSEEACRQAASRARRRVRDERRRFAPQRADAVPLVDAFLHACLAGDLDGLHRVLVDDVVLVSDGGAAVHAARRPVVGFARVARFLVNVTKRLSVESTVETCLVNGEPGAVVRIDGQVLFVAAFELDDVADTGAPVRARAVRIISNPDKLRHLVT